MIIGLVGLKGVGKDTTAAYLIKQHQFERRAFADPLKRSVAALLDIPFHEVDKLKNVYDCRVEVGEFVNGDISGSHISSMSFREFLQRFGTEAHRDVFGRDFWLDATLPLDGFYAGRALVVTDVRFENEAERVKDLGGYLVRILRPEVTPSEKDLHRSELEQLAIEVDGEIMNDGTIEDLHRSCEAMLNSFYGDE